MSKIISKAAKGSRKQIKFLYETNRDKVYYISRCLTLSEEEASNATVYAFNNAWSIICGDIIETEQQFSELVIRQAVDWCKRKALKNDPKAFKLPQDRNFLINTDALPADTRDVLDDLLNALSTLQRFIFVLHAVAGYTGKQIAEIFKFDTKTVDIALTAQITNINRLLKNQKDNKSYEYALSLIKFDAATTTVSPLADKKIVDVIDRICLPVEKKKRRNRFIIAVAAILCACIIGGVWYSASSKVETTATDSESSDAADSDSTESENLLDTSLTYYADIVIEDYGTITVELDQSSADYLCKLCKACK